MSSLDISLTKSQSDFLALDCTFPLFVAGLGSGKSYLMGLNAVLSAMHSGGALIGVYEPSHELTRLVAFPNVCMWLDKLGIEYDSNKNDHTITTKDPNIGNFLFKSYDNPDLLIGYETYQAHVDEIDTLDTEKAQVVWDKIISRNRQNLSDVDAKYKKWSDVNQRYECINRTCAYSSPEGFRFTYRMWGPQKNPSYKYVKGRTADNPAVTEAYIAERTATMSQAQIDAYLNGEWRNLTSGTVYNGYDREMHRSYEKILAHEPLYIGMDFNVYNMAATVYVRRDGGREWHAVEEISGGKDTPSVIECINNRYANKGHKIFVYPDSSGDSKHTSNGSISDLALLREAGYSVRAKKKNPHVKDRVAATNGAFTSGKLFVNDFTCPTVADCFEQQAYDKLGRPDKDNGKDHQNDASTYPIAYEMPIRKAICQLEFKFFNMQ